MYYTPIPTNSSGNNRDLLLYAPAVGTGDYNYSSNRTAEQPIQVLILLSLGHNNDALDPNAKQVKLCTEGLLYGTVGATIYQTNAVPGTGAGNCSQATAPQVCQHLRYHTQCCVMLGLHRAQLHIHSCALFKRVTARRKLCLRPEISWRRDSPVDIVRNYGQGVRRALRYTQPRA
jgi:hypothetical protein